MTFTGKPVQQQQPTCQRKGWTTEHSTIQIANSVMVAPHSLTKLIKIFYAFFWTRLYMIIASTNLECHSERW